MKKWKTLSLISFCFIVILLFMELKDYSRSNSVIAKVNNQSITTNDLNKLYNDRYKERAIDDLIDQNIIKTASKDIPKPSQKELESTFKYYQLYNRGAKDFNKHKKEIETYYYHQELIKKYILKNKRNKKSNSKIYSVVKVQGQHKDLGKIEENATNLDEFLKLSKEKNLEVKKEKISAIDNSYHKDFSKFNEGAIVHIMTGSSGFMTLLYIEDIQTQNTSNKSKQNDYIAQNYFQELTKLKNHLRNKYNVKEF